MHFTIPETQFISPRTAEKRELFPQPAGPIIAVKLPFLTDMLMPWMKTLDFSAFSSAEPDASSFLAHSKDPLEIRMGSVLTGWASEETGTVSEAIKNV